MVAALLLAARMSAGQTHASPTLDTPVAIAIMRVDGLLIPLVTLHDEATSSLSVSDPEIENRYLMTPEARGLEARPWTLWKRSGGSPAEIRVTGRVITDFGYHFHETWTTSFDGGAVPKYRVSVVKVGLATQGAVVVVPENVVSQPDAASQRVGRLVTHLAHAKEAEMVKTDPHHPLRERAAAVRASTIVRLTKLWRRRAGDTDTYYFEAVKQHGYLPVLTTGWIVDTAGKATSTDVTSFPSDDTHKQGVYSAVLGIVPFRGRDLWLMESHGWESESYWIRAWPSGDCLSSLGYGPC